MTLAITVFVKRNEGTEYLSALRAVEAMNTYTVIIATFDIREQLVAFTAAKSVLAAHAKRVGRFLAAAN